MPDLAPRNAQGFQECRGKPRQFGAGVDEHVMEELAAAWRGWVFDLDVDPEASHFVGHDSSCAVDE
jgi:hypothetical protein